MQQRTFKILSVDGGGIKGLYSALVLKQLEDEFGGNISDYFDLIAGTSTGGLIALALSLKIPSQKIVEFYEKEGPKIFKLKNKVTRAYGLFKQALISSKYSHKNLEKALKGVLGEHIMNDANNLLLIPSYNMTTGAPRMFKYPHLEGNLTRDGLIKMRDVALATSSAPTFFPLAEVEGQHYVDGGVWANNPTLCGLREALKYFVGTEKVFNFEGEPFQYDSFQILSIASVTANTGWNFKRWKKRSFLMWRGNLFQTCLEGQNYFADFFLSTLIDNINPPGKYYRIPSPIISAEHLRDIEMDKANSSSLKLLTTYGNNVGHDYRSGKRPLIEPFFLTKKTYKIK